MYNNYDGYDLCVDMWLNSMEDDTSPEVLNNEAAYQLGLNHSRKGYEIDTSHCQSEAMINAYKLGYRRGENEKLS